MKFNRFISLLTVTVILAACGNKETPLTAEQKAKLKEVGSSSNAALSAPESRSSTPATPSTGGSPFGELFKATSSGSGVKSQLESKLATAGTSCDFKHPDLNSSNFNPSSFHMGMNVSGDKCPISMSFNMSGGGSSSSGEVKFDFNYVAKDEEYKKLSDIASIVINGQISGSQNSANIKVTGKIVSLKYGDINLKITGSGSQNGGEINAEIQMSDFTAHIKMTIDNGKIKYELNGEEVSANEANSYMN